MLQWILDFQQSSKLLCFWSDEDVPFQSSGQDPEMFRPTDEGWKIAFGKILAREACSYGSTAIVEDDGCIMDFCHVAGIRVARIEPGREVTEYELWV